MTNIIFKKIIISTFGKILIKKMNTRTPNFSTKDNLKFFRTLNSRVNAYFKENNVIRKTFTL